MATIQVTAPNGRTIRIQAPEGATEDEIRRYVGEIARTQPELGLPIPGMPDMPEQAPEEQSSRGLGRIGDSFRFGEARAIVGGQTLARDAAAATEESAFGRGLASLRRGFDDALLTNSEGDPNLLGRAANYLRGQAQAEDGVPREMVGGPEVSQAERAQAIRETPLNLFGQGAQQTLDAYERDGFAPMGLGDVQGLSDVPAFLAENIASSLPQMGVAAASGGLAPITNTLLLGGEINTEISERGDVPEDQRVSLALGGGAVMAALDAIGLNAIVRGMTPASVASRAASGELADMLITRGVPAAAARVIQSGIVEGSTEAMQEGVIMAAGALGGVDYDTSEVVQRLFQSAVTGGAVGTTLRGGGEVASGILGGGRSDDPSPTGSDLDAELAAEEAALAAAARQEEQAKAEAEDREVRETRLEYAPTFVSETDFVAQRQAALRADAENADTETGQAFREYLINEDILPTNEQERTTALNAFVKSTLAAQDRDASRVEYRTALDDHIGRMRDLENVLTQDPEAGTQLEMDLGDAQPDAAPAPEPTATEDGQLEMDLQQQEDTAAQLDPARMAAEIVKAAGVQITDNVVADISARMEQIKALPVAERPAAARMMVANYTTPQKKAPKAKAAQQAQALQQEVARVPDPITMETPVRRRQDGQAKADALLPANWTEDARYDNVNSALNGKNFNIKKFNDALQAAVNPQETAEAAPTPEAATETEAPKTALAEMDQRADAYATEKLGPNWRDTNPSLVETLDKKRYARFNKDVDAAASELTATTEEAPAETLPAAAPEASGLLAPEAIANANLSGNEQKVFNVLMEAFQNNDQDAVLQADGSWNTAEIGKRAGVGTKTANTYIKRTVNKIAKSIGATPEQMRDRLREVGRARRQGEAAPGFDAPVSVLDAAELGDSVSTKASANQGARDGMSKEDIEYMENRSNEPDAYENKRQEIADRERLADTARMVKTYGRMAIQMWQNISSGGAVRVQDLSPNDMREWLGAVEEHAVGEITYDQLVADQREMERRYDANQDGVTMEDIDGQEAIEGTTAGGGTNVDGVQGAGAAQSQEGGDQAQQVRGADTGTPRGEAGQQDTGVVGEAKAAPKVEVKRKRKITKPPKFSLAEAEAKAEGTTARGVKDAVKWLIGAEANWRVSVLQNPDDLVSLVLSGELSGASVGQVMAKPNAQGVVITDNDGVTRAFFFTDNIRPGAERAVVMHEVGSHIGMDNVLTREQKAAAVKKIKDWATSEGKSLEKTIAERAIARVDNAVDNDGIAGETADEIAANIQSEYLAYFLEEAVKAGVTPNSDSKSDLVNFIRQLWADFKRALRKLRPENEPALTAQDFVNMARGAARLELATNYHGTTAGFRRFNSDFMGTGEGNAAFGSGTYIAEYIGTGDFYMRQDMKDKGSTLGKLMRVDIAVTPEESLDWYARVADQPQIMEAFDNFPEDVRDGILEDFNTETVAPLTGRQLYIGLAQLQLRDYILEQYIDDAAYDRANRARRNITAATMMASSFLDANGIKAIRYLDKASREGKTQQTDNYVVFNDDNVVKVGENVSDDVLGETTRSGTVRFSMGAQNASRTERFLTNAFGGSRSAQIIADTKAIFRKPLDATKFLHQFIDENRTDMPSAGKWYDAMLDQEQTVNEILSRGEPIVLAYRELKADRQALVNDFIGASTFYQKWGYDPQWQNKTVKVDPVMKAKYDRLTAEEQQIVRDIFQHGENMRLEMEQLAKQLGVPPKMFSMNSKLDGPYAPLKRFGDNVAVLRSQQLADMEAQLRQNPQDKKLADAVERMKGDGAHYIVSFFNTIGAAEKFAYENRQNFPVSEVSEKAPDTFGDRITNPEAFAKVISAVEADSKSGLDDTTRQAVTKIVERLFYESLGEQNARLSGARRLNRAGYEKDMVRSFMSHLQAQARLVAQLKHGAEINTAFAEAQREAASDRRRLQPVFNMIARKYNHVLTKNRSFLTSVQDNIAAFNTVYMLTSNIGYHVANATQPMISVAKMAGDFGKYPGAWGALIRGYKNSRNVVNSSIFKQAASALTVGFVDMNNKVEIDVSKAPPKYRKLLETLQLRQLLDVGMEEDLNLENRFDTGYGIVNKASEGFSNMTHRLYQVARYVEAHNRVASAIAAYDMAQSNPAALRRMKMTPEEYAISVVQDTQGNFSNFDAPLLIDALPKLTTQFRKFQLMMAWLYGNSFKKAWKGADRYEKAAGWRTLGYLTAHAAALSGVSGIPLVSTIAPFVLGMMGDEDEPEDLERYIREELFPDDDRMADLVARGVPAFFGIDMSTKLTQGDIFTPVNLQYIDAEPSAQGARNVVVQALFGPTSGVISNMGRAAQFLSEGDIVRGTEYLVPRGVRSILETSRYATEGYTLNNGDVILDPREIDISSLLLNAIGLPPEEISQLRWTRGQQIELKQYFSKESGRIRSDYVEAYQSRDRDAMAALRREFRDLQEAKDRIRPFFNNSRDAPQRQPMTDLLSAPREQRRRETRARESLGMGR